MSLKTFEQSNLDDPEEMAAWALVLVPGVGSSPLILPVNYAAPMSKHLCELGFRHVSQIAALADENGMIHVDRLPKPEKKFRRPYRGQQSTFNPAGQWVAVDDPDPEPVVLPNVNVYTPQENEAILAQYAESGALDAAVEARVQAEMERFRAFVVGEKPGDA